MKYKAGDKVITRYTRKRCIVESVVDLVCLQRLKINHGREIIIIDSDMVELDTLPEMGLTLEQIRVLAKDHARKTGCVICIVLCSSLGYNLMEEKKARGRKIIETIEP